MLTLGVEEEFLLLEPGGAVAPVAADVVRHADGRLTHELMAYQVETATAVCTELGELHAELTELRRCAARAAQRAGVALVATAAPPFHTGPLAAITDNARYRELARRYPDAAAVGSCGCHVHVGIDDRDLAVDVLGRLRPWLAPLLAITTNSPFIDGVDSGWSSTRYRVQRHWPTFQPPARWDGAERYDHAVDDFIAHGEALDLAGIYLLARLSARYPTVEIRVADTCLTTDDALLLAAVVRGLVASLIDDAQRGRSVAPISSSTVDTQLAAAACHGLVTRGVGRPGRAASRIAGLVRQLLAKVWPYLDANGDTAIARGHLARLARAGTGAQRQRRLWTHAGGREGFVAALADLTVPGTAPGPASSRPDDAALAGSRRG